MIYNLPSNASFKNKIKSVQKSTALAITQTIEGSSPIKFYQELGLQYFQQRRRMRQLCLLYNFFSTGNHHIFITYFCNWEILIDTPTLSSMYFLVELNTSTQLFCFHMSLTNGIKLVQTFVALLNMNIKFFAMHY